MPDTYKLQYDGMTLTYPGWNGYVSFENAPSFHTLTLYASEGGTLTASVITGMPGDTINLTTAYNTYWRFSGYQLTGDGELVSNDYIFGNEDATICACYKKNAFTATGNFEKGSNVSISKYNATGTTNVPAKYAIHGSHTGDIPVAWYATSNRWKPSNASAYSITLNIKMNLTGTGSGYQAAGGYIAGRAYATGVCLIGTTASNSQSWSCGGNPASTRSFNGNYSKTVNSTIQDVNYGLSAKLSVNANKIHAKNMAATATYVANGTTGTWTATGIAP